MRQAELPQAGVKLPLGAIVERQTLATTEYWTVTVFGIHRHPRRIWFPTRPQAVAYAASVADKHNLPMFDNCEPDDG